MRGIKSPRRSCVRLLICFLLLWQTACLENGQMRTPAMGYNPWNAFHDKINETVMLQTADLLVKLGLVDAGYTYLVLDDGWPEKQRGGDGKLMADSGKFPSGIKSLADSIHSKGLKLGIYSDAGQLTCMQYPASLGHEQTDAASFSEWGIDFLKYDNCFSADPAQISVQSRYEAMRDALNATGRPIAFSMCEWGVSAPWEYGHQVGNSWRTNADISLSIEADWRGVIDNLDATAGLSRFAGPGAWNDCDMLEVGLPGGKRLTEVEQQAHFALWAIVKSPLFIGADLRLLAPEHLAILKADEVIALNQDPLGVAGDLVWKQGPREVWAAPLSEGDRGVVLFNRHLNSDLFFQQAVLTVSWNSIGIPPYCKAEVRDLYQRKNLGKFSRTYSASVRNHGVLALRISPIGLACKDDDWRPWKRGVITTPIDDESALGSQAMLAGCNCCDWPLVASQICPAVNLSGRLYLIGLSAGEILRIKKKPLTNVIVGVEAK